MRLLLDMDGPLADFDLAFWTLCTRHKLTMDITGLDDPNRKRFMTDNIVDPHERAFARGVVDRTHWFKDLPVVDGAIAGVKALEKAGVDVWIATKPLEVNPHCRDDKAAWTRRHLGTAMEHKLIITPDKSILSGDVLLDDAPHIDWLISANWSPVIFRAPFNGTGSKWEGIPQWDWTNPLEALLTHLRG